MKTGRNDPCPCGSGKKYKKCCLGKAGTPSQALYYRRLSEAHDRLVGRLLAHADRTFGEEAAGVAMDEFLLWPQEEDEINQEMIERAGYLFWPWFIFNWTYDPADDEGALAGPQGRTVAELYAEAHSSRLDALEKRLIECINRKPYSFWEVVGVDRGTGMTLHNILNGARIAVQERAGSEFVQPHDVLFGRAVSVDGVGMFIGLSTTRIPPGRKPEIIQLRKRLRRGRSAITDDTLNEWSLEIRELYLDIDRALHSRPEMRNTDGHVLEFHKLVYEVPSAEETFASLCDLCISMGSQELRADATLDEDGRVMRAEIPWDRRGDEASPGMPNTILGRLVIDGRRLTAEVNSAERADTLRGEIDARLGGEGRFKVDEIQDLDTMMRRHAAGSAKRAASSEHEALMQNPEVQAQVAEMFARHWESWVDQKIPALGGKSPREAVKNADGREALEGLLKDAEQGRGQDPITMEINRKGTQRVREILGLHDR